MTARPRDQRTRRSRGCAASELRLALISVVILAAGAPRSTAAQDRGDGGRVVCFVSILPQAFFVSRIGGEFVDVHVMVGPGQSPHTYEPTSRQLSELAGGRLYFSVGVAFEASLVPRIERSFKEVKVVDTSAGIALLPMLEHGDERGTVAPPGNAAAAPHSHDTGGLDPHVWLSPRLAVRIAANIRDALSRTDPARTTVYAENFDRLEKELTRVDAEITELLSPYKGREFFVFHPAYGYFADAYGLTQVAIEAEGLAPGPKHLAELIDRAKAQHTTTVFVQPQTSATYAETVAKAIGARVVPLDPLAMNYTENLLGMAHAIAGAYVEK